MTGVITVTQAEKNTGIHRRRLLRAITAGELKAQKAGPGTAVWLIDTDDLDRWIATQPTP